MSEHRTGDFGRPRKPGLQAVQHAVLCCGRMLWTYVVVVCCGRMLWTFVVDICCGRISISV